MAMFVWPERYLPLSKMVHAVCTTKQRACVRELVEAAAWNEGITEEEKALLLNELGKLKVSES